MAKNFTFKTEKPTGKYKSFDSDYNIIKLDKLQVGLIEDKSFTIRLMVIKNDIMEDKNPNSTWKWISLKKQSNSLQEAKDFLNENFKKITTKFNLYKLQ